MNYRQLTSKLFKIENVITLLAVLAAGIVFIRSLIGFADIEEVLNAILFTLGLIAGSMMIERIKVLGRIQEDIASLGSQPNLQGLKNIYLKRDQLPEYQRYIAAAKNEILITGISLATTTIVYLDYLKKKAETGCSIKLLLMAPPDNSGYKEVSSAMAEWLRMRDENLRNHIQSSLNALGDLIQSLEPEVALKIEVRVHKMVPTYGLLSIDGNSTTGKIILSLYPNYCRADDYPAFELRHQQESANLYDFFYEKTMELWRDAMPLEVAH